MQRCSGRRKARFARWSHQARCWGRPLRCGNHIRRLRTHVWRRRTPTRSRCSIHISQSISRMQALQAGAWGQHISATHLASKGLVNDSCMHKDYIECVSWPSECGQRGLDSLGMFAFLLHGPRAFLLHGRCAILLQGRLAILPLRLQARLGRLLQVSKGKLQQAHGAQAIMHKH